MNDLSLYTSVTLLATAVLPLTGWLKTHITLFKGVNTQNLSWFVAVALAFAGYALKLGIFVDTNVLMTAVYGLAAGFTANGLATTQLVDAILVAIKARLKKS